MNVVDSSAWLEYFAGTKRAELFANAIENSEQLVVPIITIYEVFKKILLTVDEGSALRAVAAMKQGAVADMDESLALDAARISAGFRIPMADSIILATARAFDAELWTQDEHFESMSNVRYFAKHA